MRRHFSNHWPGYALLAFVVCVGIALLPALGERAHAQQGNLQSETFSRCASDGVSSVAISTASAANTELVALSSGETVHVCGYVLNVGGAVGVQFITGTGTACATGEADLTGVFDMAADGDTVAVANAGADQFQGAASSALCIELSGAVQVNGVMQYVQY